MMQLVTEVEAMLVCFYAAPRGQLAAVLMDMYCGYAHLGDTTSAARIYKRLIRSDCILKGRDKPSVENVLVTAVDFTGGHPPPAHLKLQKRGAACTARRP
jgi:hypothetical protein